MSINKSGEIIREEIQSPSIKGFNLPCMNCKEETVYLNLSDMNGDEAIKCLSCEEVWSLENIQKIVSSYSDLLSWINTAPSYRPEE